MPEHSDWSGVVLGGDEPATVTVAHENGERRRLRITTEEEQRLRSMGTDVTRPMHRVGAWGRKAALKALPWVAALVATALLTSQVAKVYADHQQALDLKSSLIAAISRGSVRAYGDAFDVVNEGVERKMGRLEAVRRRNRVSQGWHDVSAEVDPLCSCTSPARPRKALASLQPRGE
jgi:hypothetical protein